MEKRRLGRTDMDVTVLGHGGSEIGFQNIAQDVAGRLLNEALDAGLNVIDTAECYATSEELIGNSVAHRRAEYFLFTKCGHAAGLDGEDWDSDMLARSIDRSLQRLKTDFVDLLQIHSCSEETLRRGDAIAVVQKAREAGKTRYIGYSGDREGARYACRCGVFDTLQTSISVADQQAIDEVMPLTRQHGLGVIVKRPIANAVWTRPTRPTEEYYQDYWDRMQALNYGFLTGDHAQDAQTALRFTLSVPGITTMIVGTTKPGRWRENAALIAPGPLTTAEYEAIRAHWRSVARPDWVAQT